MSKSQYGEWEARGEKVDVAVYEVASAHHLHGTQCLCGFESHRARSRTEHIIDVTLAALAHAGVLPRTDEERNGPELTAYLRSFTDPGSTGPVHWVGDAPTSLHGNGAASFQRTTRERTGVTCPLCITLLDREPSDPSPV